MLQAMWMIPKTWNQVTERTITNYFKESGFKVPCEDEDDDLVIVKHANRRTCQELAKC